MAGAGEGLFHQFLCVVDNAHGGQGKQAQMAAEQQRLRIGVGDTADADGAAHLGQVIFKFGAERGIFNVMDLALESFVRVVECQTAPAGAQVGMVVCTEENVMDTVAVGNCSEETTHKGISSLILSAD